MSGLVPKLPPLPKKVDNEMSRWLSAAAETLRILVGNIPEPIKASTAIAGKNLITKQSLGLDKVDNTSDETKPISNAVQAALDKKANASDTGGIFFVDDWDVAVDDKVAIGAGVGDFYHITSNGTSDGIDLKIDDYVLFVQDDSGAMIMMVFINGANKEDKVNKVTNLTAPDDTKYPSALAVKTALDDKEDTDNKVVDFSIIDDTKFPTVKAVDDYITVRVPAPPSTGIHTLMSNAGVVSWV